MNPAPPKMYLIDEETIQDIINKFERYYDYISEYELEEELNDLNKLVNKLQGKMTHQI